MQCLVSINLGSGLSRYSLNTVVVSVKLDGGFRKARYVTVFLTWNANFKLNFRFTNLSCPNCSRTSCNTLEENLIVFLL